MNWQKTAEEKKNLNVFPSHVQQALKDTTLASGSVQIPGGKMAVAEVALVRDAEMGKKFAIGWEGKGA